MLASDHVHIWLACPEDCQDPALIATYLAWLDQEERDRYERFRFDHHRHTFLVAHALLRNCLAMYENTLPEHLSFTRNPQGRPELVPTTDLPTLRFSLSHTIGLAACAVTQIHDIGLDVEYTQRKVNIAAVAKTSFTPPEQQEFQALIPEVQREYFFDHWTLKEAYAKARGLGLYLPFRRVGFQLQPGLQPSIQLSATGPQADGQDWRFAVYSPTPSHRLALAVKSPRALRTTIKQGIPGLEAHRLLPQLTHSNGVILA